MQYIVLTFALLLAAKPVMSATTYDMSLTAGRIKVKLNVKDYVTGLPVPGVEMKVTFRGANRDFTLPVSDIENGVCFGSYAYDAGLNTTTQIDCDPVTPGYSWDTSVAGRVRVFKGGSNAERYDRGTHDDAKPAGNWKTQGMVIEFDCYLKQNMGSHTVYFKTDQIAGTVPSNQTVSSGGTASNPGTPTINRSDASDFTFQGWYYNGALYDFSTPVTHNIGLVPVWTNPHVQGIIHYQVYMWDHEAYWNNPKTRSNTDITINGAIGRYSAYDFQHNDGWTNIPIDGLEFVVRCYPNGEIPQTDGSNIYPVGWPRTNDWRSYSRCHTDASGQATYIIDSEHLQYMRVGYAIDTDPDPSIIARYNRNLGYGVEQASFDWDWQTKSGTNQGAGLVGVRYVPEGPRHNWSDHSIVLASNDNDAVVVTQDMIDNGFEFTFVCYVVPSCAVSFDLDGGERHDHQPGTYPTQIFDPINSIGGQQTAHYMCTDPGHPTRTHEGVNQVFAGWYEVKRDEHGQEYLADAPFDFSREITYSLVLRAVYADRTYTVRWAPSGWDSHDATLLEKDENYMNGVNPTYDHALPSSSSNYDAVILDGWDLYEADSNGAVTFGSHGKYTFTRFIPQEGTGGMTTVNDHGTIYYRSPDAINQKDQVLIAKLTEKHSLKIRISGLKSGESVLCKVSKGTSQVGVVSLTAGTDGTAERIIYKVDAGTYTVEPMGWSWAYDLSTSTPAPLTKTLANGENLYPFIFTPRTASQHAESVKRNVWQ